MGFYSILMPRTVQFPSPQNVFILKAHEVTKERPGTGVRQDKNASASVHAASAQPVRSGAPVCTHQLNTNISRIQNPFRKGRKHLIAGRVDDVSFDRIERLRKQWGKNGDELSRSEVVSALIETALQGHVDMQYGALLKPVITNAIDNRMRARDNRLVALLVRIAFETGQIRGIVTNNLAIQPGITNENIQTVLRESEKEAKANITRRTPQIAEIIEELKQLLAEEEGHKLER
jgi:hypothetical protein